MAQSARWTAKSMSSFLSRRKKVMPSDVGRKVTFTVRGNSTQMDVTNKDGELVASASSPDEVLQKFIINTDAVSAIALSNERNKLILSEAVAAENAGEDASELYQQFMNRIQVSFNVLNPALAAKLVHNTEFSAKVIMVTTENGSLYTVDPTTISIVAPGELATLSFNIDDILGVKPQVVETPVPTEGALKA
jgi:hypothetical protein